MGPFMLPGPSGGYTCERESKITKNKPKKSTIALFQTLQHGVVRKHIVTEIMAAVNNHKCNNTNGYCVSTIAWHTTNKRIHRIHLQGKTFLVLTEKGIEYAKTRGIL